MAFTGEIRMFAPTFAPQGWALCDGSQFEGAQYPEAFGRLRPVFGGDGTRFRVPDLRGRIPIGRSVQRALGATGGTETETISASGFPSHTHPMIAVEGPARSRTASSSDYLAEPQGRIYGAPNNLTRMADVTVPDPAPTGQPHENIQPSLCVNFIICLQGRDKLDTPPRSQEYYDPFLGEIMLFAGNFAIKDWITCDGAILPISQNTALFSLFGTTYGGDGRSTFGVPDLRGRAPMSAGIGPSLSTRYLGDAPGSARVALTRNQIPAHSHPLMASTASGTSNDPAGNVLAVPASGDSLYVSVGSNPAPAAATVTNAIGVAGGGFPHNNMQPFLTLYFMMCMYGVFPPRP